MMMMMMESLLLLVALGGPGPTVVVADPVGSGIGAIHLEAAARQIRDAVSQSEAAVVRMDCGADCLDEARGRADYLIRSQLRRRGSVIEARVELIEVHGGWQVGVSLNRAPLAFGTATLDLPLLVIEVLAQLNAPSRAPPKTKVVSESEPEPTFEPKPGPKPEPVPVVSPERTAGLVAPRADPIPSTGRWVGNCVAYPEYGEVYLEPDDWERYRRYRKSSRRPLPVTRWIVEQNEESWGLNFLWITPPVLLVGGLVGDSDAVATIGGATLPVAVIAALVDAADVGRIDPCIESR